MINANKTDDAKEELKMTKYECIKGLVVPELEDYEGMETGNDFIVNVGTIWLQEDENSSILTQENGNWLDIDEQTLEEHFIEVDSYKKMTEKGW